MFRKTESRKSRPAPDGGESRDAPSGHAPEEAAGSSSQRPVDSPPGEPAGDAGGVGSQADPVASLQARVQQLEEALLRAKADFQNLQRRATSERMEAVRFGNADLIKSLLGVMDDLDRSTKAAESPENHESIVEGLKLVRENLWKALRSFEVETIPALHERFDPLVHEALLQQPSTDVEPGTVVEEVARGYRLRERVLRPAKVIVSSAPQPAAQPAAANTDE